MTLIRRASFYVSVDDLAELAYCQQKGWLRAQASQTVLHEEFVGQHGEEKRPRDEPTVIVLRPEETTALRAIGAKLGAQNWREIFLAPPRLLPMARLATAAKKAKVDAALAKTLAERLAHARKVGQFQLRPVDENPALFRLWDEARAGSAAAAAELESIIRTTETTQRKGVFRFRLLRVAASAEIEKSVVVEKRTFPAGDHPRNHLDPARARANLNAYLFKRPRWRVELTPTAGGAPLTDAGATSNKDALVLLKKMIAFVRHEAEAQPPHPARCIPCELKHRCSIYKQMKRWRYRAGSRPAPGTSTAPIAAPPKITPPKVTMPTAATRRRKPKSHGKPKAPPTRKRSAARARRRR